MLQLENERRERLVERLRSSIEDELDLEVGRFDVEFLLDLFIREVGPLVYNRALDDVHKLVTRQFDDLSDGLYTLARPVD